MTDDPDPAAVWWASLSPESQKYWFLKITGWSIEGTIKRAFALHGATDPEGDDPPGRAGDG